MKLDLGISKRRRGAGTFFFHLNYNSLRLGNSGPHHEPLDSTPAPGRGQVRRAGLREKQIKNGRVPHFGLGLTFFAGRRSQFFYLIQIQFYDWRNFRRVPVGFFGLLGPGEG